MFRSNIQVQEFYLRRHSRRRAIMWLIVGAIAALYLVSCEESPHSMNQTQLVKPKPVPVTAIWFDASASIASNPMIPSDGIAKHIEPLIDNLESHGGSLLVGVIEGGFENPNYCSVIIDRGDKLVAPVRELFGSDYAYLEALEAYAADSATNHAERTAQVDAQVSQFRQEVAALGKAQVNNQATHISAALDITSRWVAGLKKFVPESGTPTVVLVSDGVEEIDKAFDRLNGEKLQTILVYGREPSGTWLETFVDTLFYATSLNDALRLTNVLSQEVK